MRRKGFEKKIMVLNDSKLHIQREMQKKLETVENGGKRRERRSRRRIFIKDT